MTDDGDEVVHARTAGTGQPAAGDPVPVLIARTAGTGTAEVRQLPPRSQGPWNRVRGN